VNDETRARVYELVEELHGRMAGPDAEWAAVRQLAGELHRLVQDEGIAPPVYPPCPCTITTADIGFSYEDDIVRHDAVKPGRLGSVCGAPVESVSIGALTREKPGEMRRVVGPNTEHGERYQCARGHWFAILDPILEVRPRDERIVIRGTPVPAGPPEDITIREDPIRG
jgi:hypothetical protein